MPPRTRPVPAKTEQPELQLQEIITSVSALPALCAGAATLSALDNPGAFFAAYSLGDISSGTGGGVRPVAEPRGDLAALSILNLFP